MRAPPRLLAITPPSSVAARCDPGVVERWIDAGLAELGLAVLLRDPGAGVAELLDEDGRLAGLRARLRESGIPTLLSVDPGAALGPSLPRRLADAGLIGLQLRADPPAELVARVREQRPEALVGRSCHGAQPRPEELAALRRAGLDYACVAPIFRPGTIQPGVDKQAIGLEGLGAWCGHGLPVLALGGVTVSSAGSCLDAGAAGIAGISLFFAALDRLEDNAASLRRVLADAARARDADVP